MFNMQKHLEELYVKQIEANLSGCYKANFKKHILHGNF